MIRHQTNDCVFNKDFFSWNEDCLFEVGFPGIRISAFVVHASDSSDHLPLLEVDQGSRVSKIRKLRFNLNSLAHGGLLGRNRVYERVVSLKSYYVCGLLSA